MVVWWKATNTTDWLSLIILHVSTCQNLFYLYEFLKLDLLLMPFIWHFVVVKCQSCWIVIKCRYDQHAAICFSWLQFRALLTCRSHCQYYITLNYEGCSINKLQNVIIVLVFKTWKFGNIHFVGNLIGNKYCNLYDDDIVIVTSLVLETQSVSAVFCPEVYKKREVQQANFFKCQTLVFRFSTCRPNSLKHLSYHTPVKPHETIDCCDRCISSRNNTGSGRSSSTIRSRPWANFNFTPSILLVS